MTIRASLDSGASESLVNAKCVKNSRTKATNDGGTVWSTPAGELKTQRKVKAQFTSPELQDEQLVKWNMHAAEDMGADDMIIGQDTLSFLKIDIKFSEQSVCWDESKMPNPMMQLQKPTTTQSKLWRCQKPQSESRMTLTLSAKLQNLKRHAQRSLTSRCNSVRGCTTCSRSVKPCSTEN